MVRWPLTASIDKFTAAFLGYIGHSDDASGSLWLSKSYQAYDLLAKWPHGHECPNISAWLDGSIFSTGQSSFILLSNGKTMSWSSYWQLTFSPFHAYTWKMLYLWEVLGIEPAAVSSLTNDQDLQGTMVLSTFLSIEEWPSVFDLPAISFSSQWAQTSESITGLWRIGKAFLFKFSVSQSGVIQIAVNNFDDFPSADLPLRAIITLHDSWHCAASSIQLTLIKGGIWLSDSFFLSPSNDSAAIPHHCERVFSMPRGIPANLYLLADLCPTHHYQLAAELLQSSY